jgi:hypothetical protein
MEIVSKKRAHAECKTSVDTPSTSEDPGTTKRKKTLPFYGENKCAKFKCKNKAYYHKQGQILCGVHCRKPRQKLPNNPNAKAKQAQEQKARNERIKEVAAANRQEGKRGELTLQKMRMMRNPEHKDGVRLVFPNFKHQNRTDGFGCSSLSPKSMGPIDHKQPGLPMARNLENLHQGNKVFPSEYNAKTKTVLPVFFETQRTLYQDETPHRHKESSGQKNQPLFSLWTTPEGVVKRLSYVESRQVYCHFYEEFARKDPNFLKLQKMLDQGYNLEIVGYDAFVPTKSLEEHYLDGSRPFGHELVLYSLLKEERPWAKYTTLWAQE